jgi:DNA polymerase-1
LLIDEKQLDHIEHEFKSKLWEHMQPLIKLNPKIKIWSGDSLEMLFKQLHLTIPRTVKGNPSFEGKYLETLGQTNPIIGHLSQARKLHRLSNNFVNGIREKIVNGKIHPDYYNGKSAQGGTITGRFSSAHINIQQIPSRTEDGMEIRGVFIPTKSAWTRFDYSQQEPKIMLHYASLLNLPGIEEWRVRYTEEPDTDFYQVLMDITKRERGEMKTNTLALAYGMGIGHMADIMGTTEDEARESKQGFFDNVPWLPALRNFVVGQATKKGSIKTLGGRKLMFRPNEINKAFNYLCQGSAADQTKQAMIDVYEKTGKVPLCQVHDELNYDFTEEDLETDKDKEISNLMKDAFK